MNKIKTINKFKKLLNDYKKNGHADKYVYLWTDEEALIIYHYGKEGK